MRRMSVSEFKAKCLSVFDELSRGGEPVTITKRGVPIAQVGPPVAETPRRRELGKLRGTVRIVGDIVGPVVDEEEWEALR